MEGKQEDAVVSEIMLAVFIYIFFLFPLNKSGASC